MEVNQGEVNIHCKKTKVLHFSDGTEEVTDSDEMDDVDRAEDRPPAYCSPPVDESQMEWMPWLLLKSKRTGETILSGCDYVGEFLASALGITSPKFIDGEEELKKAAAEQQERDEDDAEEIREMDTWKVDTVSTTTTITEPTSPVLIMDNEKKEKTEKGPLSNTLESVPNRF